MNIGLIENSAKKKKKKKQQQQNIYLWDYFSSKKATVQSSFP